MTNLDYLYNPEAAKSIFDKNYFVDKKLSFEVIEHGMILPYKRPLDNKTWGAGGIIDREGNHIKDSFLYALLRCQSYIPPPNQFNTVQKRSFTSECLTMFGDMT